MWPSSEVLNTSIGHWEARSAQNEAEYGLWGRVGDADVSHTHILLPSTRRPQRRPRSSDALEKERHKAPVIGCKWAPHGPLVFGLLTLIWSELRFTWTPPWMLQRHIKRPSPDTLGTDTLWTMPLVLECPSAFRWCCWSNPFRHAMQPLSL